MLGISFYEFIIVAIVACVVIRPKDVPTVIKFFKVLYKKFMKLKKEILSYYKEFHDEVIDEEVEEENGFILDEQGVLQKTYDISELKGKFIPAKKNQKIKEKISKKV
jgi:Sec-independent protein translocase protein TatA